MDQTTDCEKSLPNSMTDVCNQQDIISLLFASAAEAIRLEAAIIGIPGHAFIAIRTDQINANYYFIETTMIGNSSFSDAVDRAAEEYQEVSEKIENGESQYNWLTIATAREKGIFPLP